MRFMVCVVLAGMMAMGARGYAQQSAPAPAKGAAAAPAAESQQKMEMEVARMELELEDWAQLERYRAADYGFVGGEWWEVFSGEALCESRDQRADHAADAGAISAGCGGPASGGGGDPGRDE